MNLRLSCEVDGLEVVAGAGQLLRLIEMLHEGVILGSHRVEGAIVLLQTEAGLHSVAIWAWLSVNLACVQNLVDVQLLHLGARHTERVLHRLSEVAAVSIDRGGAVQSVRAVFAGVLHSLLARAETFAGAGGVEMAELTGNLVAESVGVGVVSGEARRLAEGELLLRLTVVYWCTQPLS